MNYAAAIYGSVNNDLIDASKEGDIEKVTELLKKDNVNLKNKSGNTALILASKNNYIAIVDLLLKAGAKVDKQNKNGYTALMGA
jgi:ankyrin repeat protein